MKSDECIVGVRIKTVLKYSEVKMLLNGVKKWVGTRRKN